MGRAPVPTPDILWRQPPVLALAALPGAALGHLGEPSLASSQAWVAAGAAVRALHDAPLPPRPGRSVDELTTCLDAECEWLLANDVLPTDVVTRHRRRATAVLRPWMPVFIHGDLQVDYVFVEGDQVTGSSTGQRRPEATRCSISPSSRSDTQIASTMCSPATAPMPTETSSAPGGHGDASSRSAGSTKKDSEPSTTSPRSPFSERRPEAPRQRRPPTGSMQRCLAPPHIAGSVSFTTIAEHRGPRRPARSPDPRDRGQGQQARGDPSRSSHSPHRRSRRGRALRRADPVPAGRPAARPSHSPSVGPVDRQARRPRRAWGRASAHAARRVHHGRPGRRGPVAGRPDRGASRDPRTTTIYDRRRENFDRHAAYVVVAFVAGG
jgi:hypothetical protein